MVAAPASDASTLKLQPHSLDFLLSSPPHTFPKWIKPTQEGLIHPGGIKPTGTIQQLLLLFPVFLGRGGGF